MLCKGKVKEALKAMEASSKVSGTDREAVRRDDGSEGNKRNAACKEWAFRISLAAGIVEYFRRFRVP